MSSEPNTRRESIDANKVNAAIEALASGNIGNAESLLLEVIANTPLEYSNSEEDDEGISIKFWDQTDFIHYVTWQKKQGLLNKNICWIGNAYPRAHYYMGFLCVKRKQFDRAIEFLSKGQSLEPTNPKFVFEMALALMQSGRRKESLVLYDQITEITPYVSLNDLAVACRGRGFVLIEMGKLDKAEVAFKSSLQIEPNNDVALNELQYIKHLRQGGSTTFAETVPSTVSDLSRCSVCGQEFNNGTVVSLNGMPISICKQCDPKLTKKWWQFWK